MTNKQIKDFPRNNNVADSDLFLKSTVDGGLSTVNYGTIKSDIVNSAKAEQSSQFFRAFGVDGKGNPNSITINAKFNHEWGVGMLYVDNKDNNMYTFTFSPLKSDVILDNYRPLHLLYDSNTRTYTITGLAGVITSLMLFGPLSDATVAFNI